MVPANPASLYPRSRAVRALIRHARPESVLYGRCITEPKHVSRSDPCEWRRCPWCGALSDGKPGAFWHPDCLRVYSSALGLTTYRNTNLRLVHPRGGPYLSPHCATCGVDGGREDIQVDHHLSLMVARAMQRDGARGWWKAWHYSNLRVLCSPCHKAKTAQDHRDLKAYREARGAAHSPAAAGVTPAPTGTRHSSRLR